MRALLDKFAALKDQLKSWGTMVPRAGQERGTAVLLYERGKSGEPRLVGRLSQDRDEFVFEYDSAFASSPDIEPLSPFPQLRDTYRSKDLWPFFAVRIPPLRRADVRALLESRGVKPGQTLQLLGLLARKSATNPYELRLENEEDEASEPGAKVGTLSTPSAHPSV